jgi:glycosyltransferase involved in cell wall biosynthesis
VKVCPTVSIGLFVYNGESFLPKSLDSLLWHTFQDFELIISDNASTDRTEEICRAYAARDRRIRYYRNEERKHHAKPRSRAVNFLIHGACVQSWRYLFRPPPTLLSPAFKCRPSA